jgi:ribosomal protein L29
LHLQNLRGNEAKGMTAKEFEDCIRDLKEKLTQLWEFQRCNDADDEPLAAVD